MGITLVTGGTGYLGRYLIDSLLEDEVPVRALVYSEWKGEELAERGVYFDSEPLEIRPGTFIVYFQGPDGEVCEMRQIPVEE